MYLHWGQPKQSFYIRTKGEEHYCFSAKQPIGKPIHKQFFDFRAYPSPDHPIYTASYSYPINPVALSMPKLFSRLLQNDFHRSNHFVIIPSNIYKNPPMEDLHHSLPSKPLPHVFSSVPVSVPDWNARQLHSH